MDFRPRNDDSKSENHPSDGMAVTLTIESNKKYNNN